jgi:hypothetical protein
LPETEHHERDRPAAVVDGVTGLARVQHAQAIGRDAQRGFGERGDAVQGFVERGDPEQVRAPMRYISLRDMRRRPRAIASKSSSAVIPVRSMRRSMPGLRSR